jgi:cysteinyl-tRNA synthetase
MVNLAGEKMAKSTGHIVDLLTALEEYPPLAVRLFYLRTHYRKPLEFSVAALDDTVRSLDRLWAFRRRAPGPVEDTPDEGTIDRFRAAGDKDFDMAGGLAVLFDAVREGNTRLDEGGDAGPFLAAYDEIVGILGLGEPLADLTDVGEDLRALGNNYDAGGESLAGTVALLLIRRATAREGRDWSTADAIRDGLAGLGIVIEDTADGARWHRG